MNNFKKKISIITPCYNEEGSILECYKKVKDVFTSKLTSYNYEHIFTDNFSTDNTIKILKEISKKDTNVKIIINSRNFGVFRSTFNAIKRSTGDAVVPKLDADLQDPPNLIIDFVKNWENGHEVTAGRRNDRKENFFMKNIRKVFYRIITLISDFRIHQDVGEYQLIDRKVVNALLTFDDYNPYIRGMIANCGFETKIINYTHQKRYSGKTKFNLLSYLDIFFNAITSFSHFPMRVCIFLGSALSLLSITYSGYLTIMYLFFGLRLENKGVMTLLVVQFFFSGVILLFLGLLGEYVGAIHSQVRKGPLVFERELINFDDNNKE